MKKIRVVFLAVALCACLMGCSINKLPDQSLNAVTSAASDAPIEGGYAGAEEAAEAYLAALREADVKGMLRAFAIETHVDHFDFEAQLLRLQSYQPAMDPRFPAANALTRELNIYRRISTILILNTKVLDNNYSAFPACLTT